VKHIPRTFSAKLHLHPDNLRKGLREYTVKPLGGDSSATFWVARKDVEPSRIGNVLRLMELFNLKIESASVYAATAQFEGESYEQAKSLKAQLIHWVPVGKDMPCQVVMPDATKAEGIAESICRRLEPGSIIQFERFGFVRIEQTGNKLTAHYAHK
jgi:glutamyl-tRNA synthetase